MKILLKNADLIIDDRKEILKGAILIEDNKIKDVYYHGDKRTAIDGPSFDLKGLAVMPLPFALEDKSDVCCYHPFKASWQDNDYLYKLFMGKEYVLINSDDIDRRTMKLLLAKIAKERIIIEGENILKVINYLRSLNFSYRDIVAFTVINYQRKTNGRQKRSLIRGQRADLLIADASANRFLMIEEGKIKGGIHVVY